MVSMTVLALALLLVEFDGPKPAPSPADGDPVALFLDGKREEALDAAKKLVVQKPTNFKEQSQLGQLAFAQGLVANSQDDGFLAEERFKTAARHYLKAGRSQEAALSLGEQAYCLTLLCKFKESEQILKQALEVSGQANQKEPPEYVKNLREYEGIRKKQIQLAESYEDLKKSILLQEKDPTTPIKLQLDILVRFGEYWISQQDWEPAYFHYLTAQKLSDTHPIASEEKKQEIRKNLAKAKSKLEKNQEK